MHGFPFWFGLLLHPVTWVVLLTFVVIVVVLGVRALRRRTRVDEVGKPPASNSGGAES